MAPPRLRQAVRRRELSEELGLDFADVRGPVWRLTRLFPMEHWDGQTDVKNRGAALVALMWLVPDRRIERAVQQS